MTDESDDILSRVDNGTGYLTLNRPKAINSLNQSMVSHMRAVLTEWEQDSAISAVVLSGAGERGLCAGGDVVAIYHSARSDGSEARRFWYDEYLMNRQIGRFPKKSLVDGRVVWAAASESARPEDPGGDRHVEGGDARGRHRLHPPMSVGPICFRAHPDSWVCTPR